MVYAAPVAGARIDQVDAADPARPVRWGALQAALVLAA